MSRTLEQLRPLSNNAIIHQQPHHQKIVHGRSAVKPRWVSLPPHIVELIFSYVELSDLANCALTCKKWYKILSDENSEVWRSHCCRKLSKSILKSDVLSSVVTYKSKLRAWYYSWDASDCSRNIYIKVRGLTALRGLF